MSEPDWPDKSLIADKIPGRGMPLAIVVIAFVFLAAAYSFTIPVYEAPDEAGHVAKINFLLTNHALPDLRAYSVFIGLEPPLYHAIGAFILYLMGGRTIELPLKWNPQPNQSALYTHSAAESDYSSAQVQAFHVLRLFSVLLGALTLIVTYSIGMVVFRGRIDLALFAAAMNAFIPQFTFMSAVINYDVMLSLFSALSIYFAIKILESIDYSKKAMVYTALANAASILTKYTGLFTVVLAFGAIVAKKFRSKSLSTRKMLVNAAILLLTVGLLAGWFFVRNQLLYGTAILLFTPTLHPEGVAILPKITSKYVSGSNFLPLLLQSFWFYFGWMNIPAPIWVYWFLATASVVAAIGISLTLRYAWRRDRPGFLRLMVCVAATLLVFAETFAYNLITFQPQGRFIFPAISAIAVLTIGGLAFSSEKLFMDRRLLPMLLVGFLIALDVWGLAYLPLVYNLH